MPYIKPNLRQTIDSYIDKLSVFHVKEGSFPVQYGGELNYAITRICDNYIASRGDIGYAVVNEVVGVLECAKLELYRRIAAPYEDTKLAANGDVYTCNKSAPKG